MSPEVTHRHLFFDFFNFLPISGRSRNFGQNFSTPILMKFGTSLENSQKINSASLVFRFFNFLPISGRSNNFGQNFSTPMSGRSKKIGQNFSTPILMKFGKNLENSPKNILHHQSFVFQIFCPSRAGHKISGIIFQLRCRAGHKISGRVFQLQF